MKIERSSFWLKVAYSWTLAPGNPIVVPDRIGLCELFWRCVSGILIHCLWFVFVVTLAVFAFLVSAERPVFYKVTDQKTKGFFVPIKRWPFKSGGENVPPAVFCFVVMVVLVIAWIIFWVVSEFSRLTFLVDKFVINAQEFMVQNHVYVIAPGILCFVLAVWLVRRIARTEGWRIFRAYISSKKAGVCPIVEIV